MARNIVPWAPKLAQVSSNAKYRGTRVIATPRRLGWMVWAGFLVVFAFNLMAGDSGVLQARTLEKELAQATHAKARWQKEFDRLSRDLAIQENDPRSYEKPAREKYRMVKDSERLYLFEDDGIVPSGPWDQAWEDSAP